MKSCTDCAENNADIGESKADFAEKKRDFAESNADFAEFTPRGKTLYSARTLLGSQAKISRERAKIS